MCEMLHSTILVRFILTVKTNFLSAGQFDVNLFPSTNQCYQFLSKSVLPMSQNGAIGGKGPNKAGQLFLFMRFSLKTKQIKMVANFSKKRSNATCTHVSKRKENDSCSQCYS